MRALFAGVLDGVGAAMRNENRDLAEEARDCRETAKRARRFIDNIGSDVDGMYLRFAEDQERRAAELEAAIRRTMPGQVGFQQSNSSSRAATVQDPSTVSMQQAVHD